MVSRAFLVFVLYKHGVEAIAVCDLDKINFSEVLLTRLCGRVSDVISVVLKAAAAVHNVLPLALKEPKRALKSVIISAVAVSVRSEQLLAEIGGDDLLGISLGGVGVKHSVNENSRSGGACRVIVHCRPEEESCLGLYDVRVYREEGIKLLPVLKRSERGARRRDVHIFKFLALVEGRVQIIGVVYLDHRGCPEVNAALVGRDHALVVPHAEKVVGRVGVNSRVARSVEIESAAVLEYIRVCLTSSVNVKFKLHIRPP